MIARATSRPALKEAAEATFVVDMDPESARIDDALIAEQSKFDGIHVVETSLDAPALEVVKNLQKFMED